MRIRMNKKTIISLALCIGVFFMAVGYSILMSELKINGSASISSTWDVRITGINETSTSGSAYNIEEPSYTVDTAKFNVSLVNPGDAKSFEVIIQNKGTITAILNSMDITTSGTDAIIYEVDGLKDGDTIAAGETKTLNITVRYNSNVIGDPNDRYKRLKVGLEWVQYTNQSISAKTYTVKYNNNGGTGSMDSTTCTVGQSCTLSTNTFTKDGATFAGWATSSSGAVAYADGLSVKNLTSANKSITLYAVWTEESQVTFASLSNAMLTYNTPQADTSIDFSQSSSDTNGKGLYYTSTNTEDGATTYYYRGAVDNNYVSFAGQTWRIVRINEDGSIRIITQDSIGISRYNSSYSDNAYVGYMYGTTGSSNYADTHANTNESDIKQYLDKWYTSNLNSYGSLLSDAGFCNDRSIASTANTWTSDDTALGYGNNITAYGPHYRTYSSKKPQFACPNSSNDLFTTSTSSKGNKALSYPIGLLTIDEFIYAGIGTTGYLANTTGESDGWWTMSPWMMLNEEEVNVFGIYTEYNGGANMYLGSTEADVRPVVNIRADVSITLEGTGDPGTSTNPYIIKTN